MKYIDHKNLNLFFEDTTYRKKELTEISLKVQEEDAVMLRRLAKLENVDLLELIVFTVCGHLNTGRVPPNIQQILINLTLLSGKTNQGATQLLEKLVPKVFCTRILLSLIYALMKLKDPFWKEFFKDKEALRILESFAALEEESELWGLLPPDLFSREIKPSYAQI